MRKFVCTDIDLALSLKKWHEGLTFLRSNRLGRLEFELGLMNSVTKRIRFLREAKSPAQSDRFPSVLPLDMYCDMDDYLESFQKGMNVIFKDYDLSEVQCVQKLLGMGEADPHRVFVEKLVCSATAPRYASRVTFDTLEGGENGK